MNVEIGRVILNMDGIVESALYAKLINSSQQARSNCVLEEVE